MLRSIDKQSGKSVETVYIRPIFLVIYCILYSLCLYRYIERNTDHTKRA